MSSYHSNQNKNLTYNNINTNKILMKPVSANPRRLGQSNAMRINAELKTDPNNNTEIKPIKKIYETPGVGSYNLDTLFSVEYKVAKNCSKNTIAFSFNYQYAFASSLFKCN